MGFALALIGAGAALNIFGQRGANRAEARAQRANAAAYLRQRHAAEVSSARELSIFQDESDQYVGNQVTEIARAGIQIDGSALSAITTTKAKIQMEYNAIKFNAAERSALFTFQASEASRAARRLSSSGFNNMQTIGALLNSGGRAMGLGGGTASDSAQTFDTSDGKTPSIFNTGGQEPQLNRNRDNTGLFVQTGSQGFRGYDYSQPWIRR